MAETTLVSAETVTAAASCTVEAYPVPNACEVVTFRVEADQTHTCKFYGAEDDFSAITAAALIHDETRTGVASTSGTDGNLYLIDPGNCDWIACVVTNNAASASATVTVAAES
jgi:hypothetical protein